MKTKQLLPLAVIFALLVAGIVFKQNQKRPELATQEYASLDLAFNPADVRQLTLLRGAESKVQLKNEKGRWHAVNFMNARADEKKIEEFLLALKSAEGEKRGSGKEILEDFGILEARGITVTLEGEGGKKLLGMVIGTQKAGQGNFVRRQDSLDVYFVETNFLRMMGVNDPAADDPEVRFWLSQKMLSFDPQSVSRIEIKNFENGTEKGTLGLQKEGEIWKFLQSDLPFIPDPAKVMQYLLDSKTYTAVQTLDPKAKDYGFSKPNFQLKLTLDNGSEMALTAGDAETPERETFYIQVSNEPVVYTLSKFYLENLAAGYNRFFLENPLGIEAEKLDKLTLRADKTEMTFEPAKRKWAALTSYLDTLKFFRVSEISNEKPRFGKYWLEIQKKGEASVFYDFADISTKDKKAYAFQKRGNPYVFSLDPSVFGQVFDNPGRLTEPAAQ